METRFRNRYLIASTRLQNYDYSSNGYYFITICSKNRDHFFGEIVNDRIKLSKIGRISEKYWLEIPKHFPFVKLDEFVVMPNHIHGIVVIEKLIHHVETQNFASLQKIPNKFGPQSENLASIVRGFKIGVKKYATVNKLIFDWQPRFYDHIIRNEKSYYAIMEYIKNNPKNWNNDRNNIKINKNT